MSGARQRRRGIALALATALAVAVPAAAAEPPGAATPQALVARMKGAAEKKDLGEMMACLSANGRRQMVGALYLGATMMVAFSQMGVDMGEAMAEGMTEDAAPADKAKAEARKRAAQEGARKLRDSYNTVVARHGLPPISEAGEPERELDEADLEKAFAKLDSTAFARDLMAFMQSLPGAESREAVDPSPVKLGDGVLSGLAISGDRATATLDGEPVIMVREGGRWFFEIEEPEDDDEAEDSEGDEEDEE
jgi:hypothetical protein